MTSSKGIFRIPIIMQTLFVALLFAQLMQAQNDAYYNTIDPSNSGFVYSLKQRIRSPYTKNLYGNYDETIVANFYARDTLSGQKVVTCVYSGQNYVYTPPFAWTTFSREHTWCHSWMPSYNSQTTDEYQDYHHLFPTNQNGANGPRSNHPLGIVTTVTSSFLEGKLGTNAAGETVYEPRNSQKGDAARALLYMSVKYDSINGLRWTFDALNARITSPTWGEAAQSLQTLLNWHKQDPPDEFEVARNNYIESIQSNRNPFIDHPEYVNYINFADGTKLTPSYAAEPTNFPTAFTATANGTSITLNWTDATGAQLPAGYFIEAFSTNSYIIPIDGYEITQDANLSDGRAFVYVAQGVHTYQFTGLNPNTTYYFRVHSYNGSGSTINFKLGSTRPSASATTGTASSPTITVSSSALSFGGIVAGTTSSSQSYTISGSSLTGAVTVTAPTGMQVSLSSGSGYASTLNLTPSGGSISSTTIYARYSPSSANGAYSDTIKHTGGGAGAFYTIVTGNALSTEPTVQSTISAGSLTTTSAALTFSGGNGARRIVVVSPLTAVTFTPIDGNALSGVSSSFTTAVDQGDGNKVVYDGTGTSVTVTSLTPGTLYYFAVYEYNVGTGTSYNYNTVSPGTTSATTVANTPVISASAGSFSFAATVTGTNSSPQSFTVSGSNLTSDISIAPPAGYQVSLASGSGYVSNPSVLTVTQTGGTVNNTTVYVRFSPASASGTVTGTVTLSGTGATSQNISVIGLSLATEPTAASTVSFGTVGAASAVVNFSGGNGGNRIVVARASSAVSYIPTDSVAPSGVSSVFTTATDQGSGNKIVYNGTGTTVTVTGLTSGITYYFAVYEYNTGTGSSYNYYATAGTGNVTATATSPVVGASSAGLNFSATITGNNSASQSYTVTGSNLSADITVTPPVGYQISLSAATGYVGNPSSLTVAQTGGSVSGTTVYVRFSPSSATGSVTGNITHTSTGATTVNVPLTGTSLSVEPTVQAALSLGSVSSSSVTATLTAGNGGRRIVVAKQGGAVTYTPTDGATISGVSSSFTAATDQGSGNKVVYDGTGTSVTVTGLTASTQYYFAVYEYAMGTGTSQNYLTTSPGTGNITTSSASAFNYTWVAGSTDFASSASWSPARSTTNTQDVLNFNTGTSLAITGLSTQTVSQINISNNTVVNLSAAVASNLTVAGGTGTDVIIESGSTLQFSGATACSLTVATGATASINGSVVLGGGAHKLLAIDSGAVQFNSGAVCSTATSFSGNAFGTTNLNSVIFNAGSSYIQTAGNNPFGATAPNGTCRFLSGSWYRLKSTSIPASSNRTYANFEYDPGTGTVSTSGGSPLTFDTLKVVSGTLNIPMTGGVNIKKDLIINSGATLTFLPATSSVLSFNGTTAQRISGSGTFTLGSVADIAINNPAGVTLDRDITIKDSLKLTSGILYIGTGNLTLDTLGKIAGTPSASNMIVPSSTGEVRKVFTAAGSFTFPVGSNSGSTMYTPADVTLSSYSSLAAASYIGVKLNTSKHSSNYATGSYLNRVWSVTSSGMSSPVCSLAFTYNAADVQGTESQLYGGRWNGSKWIISSAANTGTKKISFSGVTPTGDYTASEYDYAGGAAVVTISAVSEGIYNPGASAATVSDTLTVYAASPGNPSLFTDSARAKIDSVTLSGNFAFRQLTDGTYYFAVKGGNTLKTWSKSGGEALVKGTRSVYSFISDSSKAYGNNVIRKGSIYCLYSGELNNDGVIDLSDLLLIDNDNSNFVTGYTDTDINRDGVVDLTDLLIVDNNNAAFIGTQVPPGAASSVSAPVPVAGEKRNR